MKEKGILFFHKIQHLLSGLTLHVCSRQGKAPHLYVRHLQSSFSCFLSYQERRLAPRNLLCRGPTHPLQVPCFLWPACCLERKVEIEFFIWCVEAKCVLSTWIKWSEVSLCNWKDWWWFLIICWRIFEHSQLLKVKSENDIIFFTPWWWGFPAPSGAMHCAKHLDSCLNERMENKHLPHFLQFFSAEYTIFFIEKKSMTCILYQGFTITTVRAKQIQTCLAHTIQNKLTSCNMDTSQPTFELHSPWCA